MSKALLMTGSSDVEETAKFVGMMDKLFDCLNVHDFTNGMHKHNAFQLPYRSGKDFRLKVFVSSVVIYMILYTLFIIICDSVVAS